MSCQASSLLSCQQIEFAHVTLSMTQISSRDTRWTLPVLRYDVDSVVGVQAVPEHF